MPPQQAWRYIQTNGLLTYMRYESGAAVPPFGATTSQRYAASRVPVSRYRPVPQSGGALSSASRLPSHGPTYSSSGYAQNRYYSPSTRTEAPRPRSTPAPAKPRSSSESSPPRVKIPVEEPESQVANNSATRSSPTPGASSSGNPSATQPGSANEIPFGTVVPGRINMVNSPFAGKTQLVDVAGMSAGQTVKCPYTGKLFKVPPTQQAQNKAESPASETDSANP